MRGSEAVGLDSSRASFFFYVTRVPRSFGPMPRVAPNKALAPERFARPEVTTPFGPLRERFALPEAMDELDAKVDKAVAEGKRIRGNSKGRWILSLGAGKGYVVLADGYTMTRHGQRLNGMGVCNYDPA